MNKDKQNQQAGQVLLITIMLLATALTVALSVSFKSTTETQVTKLEEEQQKALAAAEAGIEKALKEDVGKTVNIDVGGYTGTAGCPPTYDKNYFVSPVLQKDEQFTFYLSEYPGLTNYWSGNLDFYFKSESGEIPVIELTFFNAGSPTAIAHYVIDPDNDIGADDSYTKTEWVDAGYSLDNVNFQYKTSSPFPITNAKIVVARVLSTNTRIAIEGNSNLPLQGKNCDSSVTATGGVAQKVNLFQSYPQIPAEFWVTSF